MATAALGDLVVSLKGEIAQFQSSMDRAEALAAAKLGAIDRLVTGTHTALAGLGVGIGFAGLIALAKHSLDTADQLSKLSEKSGVAVEDLSALRYAAAMSDVSVESLAKGMKKLAQEMTAANDTTSKQAKIMQTLGVDVSKGVTPALEQIAGAFAKLPDGTTKAALAVELFGKQGMDLIPLLNQGKDGLVKLQMEAQRLGLVMDKETAKAAEKFNDDLKATKMAAEGATQALVTNFLPSMNRIAAAMKEAASESGTLMALWVGLGGLASEALGLNEEEAEKTKKRIREVGNEITRLRAVIAAGPKSLGDGIFDNGPIIAARLELEKLTSELRFYVEMRDALAGKYTDQVSRSQQHGAAGGGIDSGLEERLRKQLAEQQAATYLANQLAAAETALGLARLAGSGSSDKLTESEKRLSKIRNDPDFKKLSTEEQQQIVRKNQAAIAQEKHNQAMKDYADAAAKALAMDEEIEKQIAAINDLGKDRVLSLQDEVDLLKTEIGVLGKSSIERDLALLQLRREKDLRGVVNEATRQGINIKYDEIAALLQQQNTLKEQMSIWNSLGDTVGGFFKAMMNGTKSAFDYMKEQLRSFVAELIALFAKRWVLNLAGSFLGDSSLLSAAASAGNGTAAGGILNALSGAGSLYSAYSMGGTSVLSQLGSAYKLGTMGGTMYGGSTGAQAANAVGRAIGPYTSALYSAGWIAAGVALSNALYGRGWDGKDTGVNDLGRIKGTPMWSPGAMIAGFTQSGLHGLGFSERNAAILSGTTGISFLFGHKKPEMTAGGLMGNVGASGVTGQNWVDWTAKGGLFRSDKHGTDFTPFDADQAAYFKGIMANIAATIGAFASQMGVDAANILKDYNHEFKLDFKDKTDEEIGQMLGDMFTGVLQDQVVQLLKGAGQDELSAYVANLKGTSEEVTASITELLGVMKGLEELGAKGLDAKALIAWQREGETLTQTFQRVAQSFADFDDAFMTDAQKMAALRTYVTDTFGALGIAIPATATDFYNLVHGLDLSTEAGRHMFEMLMEVAPAFQQVQNATASAVANFYSLASSLSGAFGASYARMNLDAAIDAWQAYLPGGDVSKNWSNDEILAQLRYIIDNNLFSEALGSIQGFGPDALGLFNAMMSAYQAYLQAQNSGSGGGGFQWNPIDYGGTGGGLNELEEAARRAAEALWQARDSVKDWMGHMLLSDMSTLTPGEKLTFAHDQYVENLMRAQAGDLGAIQAFSGLADAYLRAAREYYASGGQYNQIFAGVMQQAGGIAALNDANRPTTAADSAANTQAIIDAVDRLTAQVAASTALDQNVNMGFRQLFEQIRNGINDGSMTFG